jgi:hypothetical protein
MILRINKLGEPGSPPKMTDVGGGYEIPGNTPVIPPAIKQVMTPS